MSTVVAVVPDRMKQPLLAVLLILAAWLAFAAPAAGQTPPPRSVYSDPGPPAPPPDSVAKDFVDRAAPSLRGVSTDELEGGVVVEEEAPASGAQSRPAAERRERVVTPSTDADARVLARAGVETTNGRFDARWAALLAGLLALTGLAVLASSTWRSDSRSRAL